MTDFLRPIFAINAERIPRHLEGACLEIDVDFPLHNGTAGFVTRIVRIDDNGNSFAEWLKVIGFKFEGGFPCQVCKFGYLVVWIGEIPHLERKASQSRH